MDQLPRSNEGFANNNMFADSQQYNAYDNLFHTGADQNSYDASWGVNASNYPVQSRAQHTSAPSWPQNANHLAAPSAHAGVNGQASPYARSLSHSPSPYGQSAFAGYGAPQNFQYRQPQYDPSLVPPHAFNQNFNYSTADYQISNAGTIAPHALQHEPRPSNFNHTPYDQSPYQVNNFGQPRPNKSFVPETVDQVKLIAAIPKGRNGGRFSIINFDDLAKATNSERMGNFLNIGTEAHNWDVNRAALPNYVPRKSRSELRKIAGNDSKLLAKLGKKTLKKERALAAAPKSLQSSTKTLSPATEKIKYEEDSSSDESSSSTADDDSSYTSDNESESPLPSKRPDKPKEGTEYDTVKALWRGKRKNLEPATIRKGLGEFWEIVKTIRDRWKLDVAAVQDAESKNRTNELPLLESRVKDQRDMLETAFKAALKHGHRGILELMSENVPLLFLCYQFLLDRVKADDYNSPLPRAILETISLFKTVTDDKLEKTHMVKVLPRFIKRGDAKTQFYAKRITANAASASNEKSVEEPSKKPSTKESNAPSPTSKRMEAEPIAGVKRSASTAADGGAQKKVATGAIKANGTSATTKVGAALKKSSSSNDSVKATGVTTAPAAKPKQVVAKPSGLFSSLQSAAKKPGTSTINKANQPAMASAGSKSTEKPSTTATANQNAAPKSTFSFAETMANLSKPKEEKPAVKQEKQAPPETAEEKEKRLRKESRRHLHVSFKTGDELVQVHEFHHDPDEELGHDASQVRDLADVGGEGRMFKQQQHMMDIDDEDEIAEENERLLEFSPPSPIDFSDIDSEQRDLNHAPFGGGRKEPDSAERSIRERYEADTLIVFYTDVNDIPPNPREPADPYNGQVVDTVKNLGIPEEKWAVRARQRKLGSPQHHKVLQPMTQNNPVGGFDLSRLTSYANNIQATQPTTYQSSTPAAPSNDAISSILASLQQAQTNQATPPVPTMGAYGSAYPAITPNMNAFPAPQATQPPTGQPDLAAILAQIQQNQPAAPAPPNMGAFAFNSPAAMPNMTSYTPQMQQSNTYENPERKQWREGGGDPSMKLRRQNPAQNPYYRTKVCKYWQEGRCQKGDQCSYRHSDS